MSIRKGSRHERGLGGLWRFFLQLWRSQDQQTGLSRISTLAAVAVLAAVVAGVFFYLQSYVAAITRQRAVELTVVLKNPPPWASEELIRQICLSSGIRSDDFLLDTRLTGKWAANLAANAWVKQVRQVRKRYDGRVELDCQLREPIAWIEHPGRRCYIDLEGVVLPATHLNERYCHLVQLRGSAQAPPAPGQIIQTPALVAGLQVLTMIRCVDEQLPTEERLWAELAALDVSNYEGRVDRAQSHLTLYTSNDTPVHWGAAVGRSRPYLEASWEYKLATLYRAHKQYGTLDYYRYVELRNRRKERADPVRQG